ncbi:MAG: radical SAM protein [Pirellula sp.]|jgi:MoaA/NifB/PqqE/SkfB family radical SAM enzyme
MFSSDELLESSERGSTLVVVVRVATDCALGCQHCGFSRDLSFARREIDTSTLLKLGASLQSIQERSNRRVLVSWIGGEPFQWTAWREMSARFKNDFGLALSVTTNGLSLASDSVRSFALSLFSEITLSIDGVEPHHDLMRGCAGMFQRLKSVVNKIQREREPGQTRLRVNTVLTDFNASSFPEFCRQMAQWGFDELTFNPLGGNDRPAFFTKHRLNVSQVEGLSTEIDRIRDECHEMGLVIRGGPGYLNRLLATARDERIPIDDCKPGENFLFVDERGLVSPCSFTCGTLGIPVDQWIAEGAIKSAQDFLGSKRLVRPKACEDCLATNVFDKFT